MLSRKVELMMNNAVKKANELKHEFITLECILWAMFEDEAVANILEDLDISKDEVREELDDFLSKLISIRNINKENVSNYLNPTIKNILPDPYILKDMDRAVKRAVKAIDNLEKVGVFGDYDVDGASSTA